MFGVMCIGHIKIHGTAAVRKVPRCEQQWKPALIPWCIVIHLLYLPSALIGSNWNASYSIGVVYSHSCWGNNRWKELCSIHIIFDAILCSIQITRLPRSELTVFSALYNHTPNIKYHFIYKLKKNTFSKNSHCFCLFLALKNLLTN